MKMNYTYSIIIPHYNSPELLKRMLASIPERDDIQILVIDDYSTSENVSKVKALSHKNLEIVFLKQNRGAGYARNVGLERVKGKWVSVVDADDVYDKDTFSILDQYIKQEGVDYFCFRVGIYNKNTGKFEMAQITSNESVTNYMNHPNQKTLKNFRFRNGVCWNKVVSYDYIQRYHIRCEECMVNNDDLYAILVSLYAKKCVIIDKLLYHIIGNENSITRKNRDIPREFLFYLQAQKRNQMFKKLGYGFPLYRSNLMYALFFLKKRGLCDTFRFFKYRKEHLEEIEKSKDVYSRYLKEVDIDMLKKTLI
jgi:glycosyltransferase involved in cell wall biosynthesis